MFNGHDGVAIAKSGVARATLRELAILRDLAQEREMVVRRRLALVTIKGRVSLPRKPR